MNVQCPACHTSFPVDRKKIPEGGVHARCSVCEEVFFVDEPAPPEMPAAAAAAHESPAEPAPAAVEPDDIGGPEAESVWGPPELGPAAETPLDSQAESRPPGEEPEADELEAGESVTDQPGAAASSADAFETYAPGSGEDELAAQVSTSSTLSPFGRRDPTEKAERLARVLVSDIILYNPDRHRLALESGNLKVEFEEEIQKSWNEYVEQVGEDVAASTSYFNDALNEILADGEQIF